MTTTLEYAKGTYGIEIEFTVINKATGNPRDLTGLTVTFKMWKEGAATNKASGTCTITDATNGKCKYTVQATDFDAVDTYNAYLELTKTGYKETTEIFKISIIEGAPA